MAKQRTHSEKKTLSPIEMHCVEDHLVALTRIGALIDGLTQHKPLSHEGVQLQAIGDLIRLTGDRLYDILHENEAA